MTATVETGVMNLENFAPKIIRLPISPNRKSTVVILKQRKYYFFYSNDELVFGLYKDPLKYKWAIYPAKYIPENVNPIDINAGLNLIDAYFDWDYVKKKLEKMNEEHS